MTQSVNRAVSTVAQTAQLTTVDPSYVSDFRCVPDNRLRVSNRASTLELR